MKHSAEGSGLDFVVGGSGRDNGMRPQALPREGVAWIIFKGIGVSVFVRWRVAICNNLSKIRRVGNASQ